MSDQSKTENPEPVGSSELLGGWHFFWIGLTAPILSVVALGILSLPDWKCKWLGIALFIGGCACGIIVNSLRNSLRNPPNDKVSDPATPK